MPTVLWWGRSDKEYSRNQIILHLFEKLGWNISFFYPVSSAVGTLQGALVKERSPDLIWVPCFRQRDVGSAKFWADRWGCPVIFDPLISSYQKEVFEKNKWPPEHKSSLKLCEWEAALFHKADLVIADTRLHADFYHRSFGIDKQKITVIHVGADERMFVPTAVDATQRPVEVLFYGSFLALHGPEVILDAASMIQDDKVRWVLLGEGDTKAHLEKRAQSMSNVRFEPWIKYDRLPERIAQAQIVLGIFGDTPKAGMVIPNKAFQAMAMGMPFITRESDAYPEPMRSSDAIGWVPAGDPNALAACVDEWIRSPDELVRRGEQIRRFYDQFFAMRDLQDELQTALDMVTDIDVKNR